MGSVIPFPEEVLFLIVKATSEDFRNNDDGPSIRSSNEQLLPISRVNRMMRRICLPIIYECIHIRLTEDTLPHGTDMDDTLLNTFKRLIGDNPVLASLVREIFIRSRVPGPRYCVFNCLPCFPNLASVEFPHNIRLDMDLLHQINAHPSLLIAYFQTEECLSLPTLLPPGSLSRVQINHGELSDDSDTEGDLWKYLTTCGLKIRQLWFRGFLNPRYFEVIYLGLRNLVLDIRPDEEEWPTWYSRFIERHPELDNISLDFDYLEMGRPQIWALQRRFFPHLRLLCDMAKDRRLTRSFNLSFIVTKRGFLPDSIPVARLPIVEVVVRVDPSATQDVICCLGFSLPALQSVHIDFIERDPPIVDVGDFVTVCREYLPGLRFLYLLTAKESLNLGAVACDGEEINSLNGSNEDKHRLRTVVEYGKEIAQFVWLLARGMLTLKCVTFEDMDLEFLIERPEDGRGTIQIRLERP